MDFPTLGIGFVGFVAQRHKASTGRVLPVVELDWAFSRLQHRPGELIDFVRFWIADQPAMGLAAALDAFKTKTRPDAAFEQQYAECSPLQKLVLDRVARGKQLFSAVTRQQIAASLGLEGAIAPSTLAGAAKTLETRGILTKAARGQYQLEDEQFGGWLGVRRDDGNAE